jgi:hypothetical protein
MDEVGRMEIVPDDQMVADEEKQRPVEKDEEHHACEEDPDGTSFPGTENLGRGSGHDGLYCTLLFPATDLAKRE